MKSNLKRNLIITIALFLLFIVFTVLVMVVDVRPIGPEGSKVGLASLNEWGSLKFGASETLYDITEILGYITFVIIGGFAVLGAYQLIKGKSIKKVDVNILALGVFYVVVLICYAIFEVVVINYRPVLIDGELEASYPSSHTMLSICVVVSAMIVLDKMLCNKESLKLIVSTAGYLLITLTVAGRLLSGVHWLTDIVGGVLLSASLVMLFYTAIDFLNQTK